MTSNSQVSFSLYTTFWVYRPPPAPCRLPPLTMKRMQAGSPTREAATDSWPCENMGSGRYTPANSRVCPLRLVNRHCEGGAHRELAAVQREWQRAVRGLHEDAGDEDPAARVAPGADLAVQHVALHDLGEQARAVGQVVSRNPVCGGVAKEHDCSGGLPTATSPPVCAWKRCAATASPASTFVCAHSGVIDYQKCGLPHAHFLLILKPADKPRNVEDFNRFVSAEIPDPVDHPQAHATVARSMMHGTCGALKPNSSCKAALKDNPRGASTAARGSPRTSARPRTSRIQHTGVQAAGRRLHRPRRVHRALPQQGAPPRLNL